MKAFNTGWHGQMREFLAAFILTDERDDEADDGAAKVLSVGSICDEQP